MEGFFRFRIKGDKDGPKTNKGRFPGLMESKIIERRNVSERAANQSREVL